ncbi:MAG: RNase adapter RapZ [Oscillospiraceae bacterium]|nr:RNase adapter RapZ [Oscillospiraceae bacterium]
MEFTILTGMSGSGKTMAIHFFEDIGYFCIDNMPPALIPMLAGMSDSVKDKFRSIALVIDIRVGDMINELLDQVDRLRETRSVKMIFLDADDNTLVRRYKETRRMHPLNNKQGLLASIREERRMLAKLKDEADDVIDTSSLKSNMLRDRLMEIYNMSEVNRIFDIKVESFGFKHGIPVDSDLVFDVRCFPNPFYIPELKRKTGNDKEVRDYVMSSAEAGSFFDRLKDMIEMLIPLYIEEGRGSLTIAIGCTGGHHRSVTFANMLAEYLTDKGYSASTVHRDIAIYASHE